MNALIFPVLFLNWWQTAALTSGINLYRVWLDECERTVRNYTG